MTRGAAIRSLTVVNLLASRAGLTSSYGSAVQSRRVWRTRGGSEASGEGGIGEREKLRGGGGVGRDQIKPPLVGDDRQVSKRWERRGNHGLRHWQVGPTILRPGPQ
jgi:hypothetical protein